jgi:hypothetical protein
VPTTTPVSATLSVSSFTIHQNGAYCLGAQTIVNNGPQPDGWTWVITGPSLPPSFRWSLFNNGSITNAGLPSTPQQQSQGFTWTVYIKVQCNEYAGPYTLHLHDSYGNDFPTGADVTMTMG